MTSASPRLKSIFLGALERPAGEERAAFLREACRGDADLLQQVVELLAHEARDTGLLRGPALVRERPAAAPHGSAVAGGNGHERGDVGCGGVGVADVREGPASRIGSYRLVERIGEGGFGTVFLAEQEQPIRRRVALKVIKEGMDTRAFVARFEAERQALALMDHPNIANVLDAGATASGRPYFVMELVHGVPIVPYCDEAKLSNEERLELFLGVCRGVQHAHQKGVIHRDLKPANILVTHCDGRPVAKIIDFGIAKATQKEQTADALVTTCCQMFGTPAYMSPEQAALRETDIDTRSDVYSLGVLLYELLTGATPIDRSALVDKDFDEVRRMIRQDLPSKPSTRLQTMALDRRAQIAEWRRVKPDAHFRSCHGDLDQVVMKALEKERERRYESASALAADIERFLRSEPVSAAAPRLSYRVRKFVARHRVAVGMAAFVIAVLVTATAMSLRLALVARRAEGAASGAFQAEARERARAEAGLELAENANAILGSVFERIDPELARGEERPLREALAAELARALEEIERTTVDAPLAVARMQLRLGHSLNVLGRPNESVPVLEAAARVIEQELGSEDPTTLDASEKLAFAYLESGQPERARPRLETALARYRALELENDERFLVILGRLQRAVVDLGHYAEALELATELADRSRSTLGPTAPATLDRLRYLALSYELVGEPDRALAVEEELVDLESRAFESSADPPDGAPARRERWIAEALIRARRVVELRANRLGENHPRTLESTHRLASALVEAGRYAEAVHAAESTLDRRAERLGREHPATLASRHWLSVCLEASGAIRRAELVAEEAFEGRRRVLGVDHPDTLRSLEQLALCVYRGGEFDRAGDLHEQLYSQRRDRLGPDHLETLRSLSRWSTSRFLPGRLEESLALAEQSVDSLRAVRGPDDALLESSIEHLADCRAAVGAQENYRSVLAERGADDLRTLEARREAAETYLMLGLPSAVAMEFLEVVRGLSDRPSHDPLKRFAVGRLRHAYERSRARYPESWRTQFARAVLGAGFLELERYSEAAGHLEAAVAELTTRLDEIPESERRWIPWAAERLVHLLESRGELGGAAKVERYRRWLTPLTSAAAPAAP